MSRSIREELIKVSKLKQKKKEKDAKFLLRVLEFVTNELPEKKWDKLTENTQRYVNNAVDAINSKESLPDFPDEVEEEMEEEEDTETEEEEEEDGEEEEEEEEEEDEDPETEEEEEKKVATKKTSTKSAKGKKKAAPDKSKKAASTKKAAPDKSNKSKKTAAPKKEAVARDKFGLRMGSKRSIAAAMFLKGCKMSDVKKETGASTYNLLHDLEKAGHTVKKDKGVIKLKFNKEAKSA